MRLVHTLFERSLPVGNIHFSPDGLSLATTGGFRGKAIRLWNCDRWSLQGMLAGHAKSPIHLAFAGNERSLLSGALDKWVKAWDCVQFKPTAEHARHKGAVTALSCSPDGTSAVSGDARGCLFSCSTLDFESAVQIAAISGQVNSLAFAPSGHHLAVGGGLERQKSLVCILDWQSGRSIKNLDGHSDWVLWVGFNKPGTLLATGSYGSIHIWDATSWKLLQVLKLSSRDSFSTIAFCFSPKSDEFISGAWSHQEIRHEVRDASGKLLGWNTSRTGLIQFWDMHSGKLKDSVEAHADALTCLDRNPKKPLLASGGADGTVKIWCLDS
jgi:WD40 repeat protein